MVYTVHETYKNSLVGKQCAHGVTITGVRRVGTEKQVGGTSDMYCPGWWIVQHLGCSFSMWSDIMPLCLLPPFQAYPGDNSSRTPLQSDLYTQVVIYDHITRRKT